jgi:hypothetical protein
MSEQKLSVICAFDARTKEMWYVDSREKLSRRLQSISLALRPITLVDLRAMVYDSERKDRVDCVVDIDGWFYTSRRARGLEKGLFAQPQLFIPHSPANQ